ncbi:MAG: hypothetical protein ABSG53_19250, partial [Thermoguttaceae bacterium]
MILSKRFAVAVMTLVSLCAVGSPLLLAAAPDKPGQPAPPDFGPNVLIFDPAMKDIQAQIDAVFKKQERNQFGSPRYAYLFKPGAYSLDV